MCTRYLGLCDSVLVLLIGSIYIILYYVIDCAPKGNMQVSVCVKYELLLANTTSKSKLSVSTNTWDFPDVQYRFTVTGMYWYVIL